MLMPKRGENACRIDVIATLGHKLPEAIPPVVVGGIGGSGTRVIAEMLVELGCHIGDDLNKSLDNLWFVLLFNYPDILNISSEQFDGLLEMFFKAMRPDHAATGHITLPS